MNIRNNNKRWKQKWPWRLFFPPRIDQRNCPECGSTYHEGPLPRPEVEYRDGHVAALVFPAGGKDGYAYSVHFGRWVGSGKGQPLFFQNFIPEGELDSVLTVANQARDGYQTRTGGKRARR